MLQTFLLAGINLIIGVYFLTLIIIFLISDLKNNKNHLLIISSIIAMLYLDSNFLDVKDSVGKIYEIPDLTLLLLVYFYYDKKILFLLAILFSFILFKHLSVILFFIVIRLFSKKLDFKMGVICSLLTPIISLIIGFLNLSAGTSLLARYRGWILIIDYFLQKPTNILYPGPFSGVKEDFFWPGDIGVFGSIYEQGLIITLFIIITSCLVIFYNRKQLSQFQLFLFGYFTIGYIGKVSTQATLF
jgi:hypothetical protein